MDRELEVSGAARDSLSAANHPKRTVCRLFCSPSLSLSLMGLLRAADPRPFT